LAINGNRDAQQETSVSTTVNFKKNCTISTGIPNLGVQCKNNDPLGLPESGKEIRRRHQLLQSC